MTIDGLAAGVLVGWWMWLACRSTDEDWGYVGTPFPLILMLMRLEASMEDMVREIGAGLIEVVSTATSAVAAWGDAYARVRP